MSLFSSHFSIDNVHNNRHSNRLLGRARLAFGCLGSGLIGLLVLAFTLPPDERGFGTHERLGLPECSIVRIFGFRCPSCGMTTSWSNLTKGRLKEAFSANASGVLLAFVSMIVGPWMVLAAVRGRWTKHTLDSKWIVYLTLSILGIVILEWCIRLVFS